MTEQDDSLVVFGTPLEPLDADELPTKRPIQLQDQKVYDENGLQRFHGAFTGGFSAGYFNTVGTKEGWSPTTFTSSRSQKFSKNVQRPEDFMDAEDLREHGIAPMRIQATEQYRKESKSSSSSFKDDSPQVIPGIAPLADILRPVTESMGVILLRKLGWRPGQGIGPKRKLKETKTKVYGCVLPSSAYLDGTGSDGEDTEYDLASNFLFSPTDVSVLPYESKDNVYGLGYKPLDSSALSSVSAMIADSISGHVGVGRGKKKVAFKGQAFGVGAFEDEDEDIYTKDDLSRYDFVLGGEDQHEQTKRSKQTTSRFSGSNEATLRGFVTASHVASFNKKLFPPPELPRGYIPKCPASKSEGKTSAVTSDKITSSIGTGRFLNRFAFSAVDRTKMIGNRFQDAFSKPKDTTVFTTTTTGARISETELTANTKVEKPSTEWENKEKAIPALKYLTILNTKFVSSSTLHEEDTTYGLSKPSTSSSAAKSEEANEKSSTDEHKCQRLIEEWHPHSLLCKRFNVPDPFPETTSVGTLSQMATRQSSQKPSIFRSLFETPISVPETSQSQENLTEAGISPEEGSSQPEEIERTAETSFETEWKQEQAKPKVDTTDEDFKPPTPPTMDLFKAIFQDSSADEDDASEQSGDDSKQQTKTEVDKELSEQKNEASISANSELPHSVVSSSNPNCSPYDKGSDFVTPAAACTTDEKESGSDVMVPENHFYGPALPPANIQINPSPKITVPPKPMLSDDKYVERGIKRKKSHHKKHKKHKRKKAKHSKSSHVPVVNLSDSSSGEDSVTDDNEVNLILIKRLKELKKKDICK